MVNITHPELSETKAQPLPPASLETLKQMREDMCSISSHDFKLQPNQRFLRRVLSPDSPTRNLLMVHGTGQGKTCTAIQIAEEYIIRPEFQDKRVFVLANPSIQENFKSQIFDITRISPDADGIVLSKQCTGRRYFDMIQRSQSQPLKYTERASQIRIMKQASRIIGEFYEFQSYSGFANLIQRKQMEVKSENEMNAWIHETFDNRLIIIDEAHNLKETTETETSKLVALAFERIIKTANGVTLVLLTATPMYDTYDEILYYLNLFLWNDRRLDLKSSVKTSDIFTESGDFKNADTESKFRGWCQDYISYVKGGNPFTFPFRLPPPEEAPIDRKTDIFGKAIKSPRKYLSLFASEVSKTQEKAIKDLTVKATSDPRLICVFPEDNSFRETFEKSKDGFTYKSEKFLAPSKVAEYSSKFAAIMKSLDKSSGIVFVYSNLVESGAQLFSMCLEEHGFEPAIGNRLMSETSEEIKRGSKGRYVLFTSEISDVEINRALIRLRRPENVDGSDIRVVVASPKVSEGVDFRYVRQIHILDPWFNMSRLEQVIGRGMRTCSHSLLPFEQQNCTVYLHICRYANSTQETLDEYIYRVFVEDKAHRIAKVKRVVMESAMDCPLQNDINSLPTDWSRELKIPQIRAGDNKKIELSLKDMSAPTFEDGSDTVVCKVMNETPDPDHERPLSAILDVKDEVLDKVTKLFARKPIWMKTDLFNHTSLKAYHKNVLSYILKTAIDSGFMLRDKYRRSGFLQSKDGVFAFTIGKNDTLVERTTTEPEVSLVELNEEKQPESKLEETTLTREVINLSEKVEEYEFPEYIRKRFSSDILEWYYIDNANPQEKIDILLSIDWENPPIYAKPLLITKDNGEKMYVLGSKKIYDERKQLIEGLAGDDKDAYNSWLTEAKERFVNKKDELFASMKDQVIIFNVDQTSNEIKRAQRSKNIGGRTCTTYTETTLNMFSKWLIGEDFPEEVKTKKDRCMFLELLVRQAIKNKREGIFWVTPEEFAIFSEDENRGSLLKMLKD